MKKHVHKKILTLAVMAGFFTANSQIIFEENFQTAPFDVEKGYAAASPNTTCTGKPDEASFTLSKTYSVSGTTVTFTFINAAVSPTCTVKNSTTTHRDVVVGSTGYAELGKLTEYTVSNVPGSLQISKLAYIGTINFNASWTGGSRKTGSFRAGELYKSTDDGASWTLVDVVCANDTMSGFQGDVYGAAYSAVIDAQNVTLKFASLNDATSQRTRIHDISVNATPVSAVNDLFVDGGASVSVNNKAVSVKSTENGTVEIVSANGIVIGRKAITSAADETLTVNTSGMYVVRLVTNNKVSIKKVLVQ